MAWNDYGDAYRAYGGRGWGYGGFDRGYSGGWSARYDSTYGPSHRRTPERSPTYGRAGDEAARQYARSHGYDGGYSIRPSGGRGFTPRGPGAGYGRFTAGHAAPRRGWGEGERSRSRYDWGYRW